METSVLNRIALLVCGVAWLAAAPAGAQLATGDLVVTDLPGLRVWQVRPSSNEAAVFSPPPAGTNLLTTPTDVATTSDRGVYVADGSRIVAIDPDTGEQSVLTRTVIDPIGGGIDHVPLIWDGFLAGIDADENDALWVVEDRVGLPGRLWKVTSGILGWARSPMLETGDLGRIDNGLAVTSDDDGDANDVFFPTAAGGVLNVDVGTGDPVAIVEDPFFPLSDYYKGGIDAVGDCEDLACAALFSSSTWLTSVPICAGSDLDAFVLVAIIAGVSTLLDGLPGCATGVAALTGSDAYVTVVDLNPFEDPAPGQVRRVYSLPSGFTSELVAELPGYLPMSLGQAVSGMDIVRAPEPGAAALGAAALATLAGCARRRAAAGGSGSAS